MSSVQPVTKISSKCQYFCLDVGGNRAVFGDAVVSAPITHDHEDIYYYMYRVYCMLARRQVSRMQTYLRNVMG